MKRRRERKKSLDLSKGFGTMRGVEEVVCGSSESSI